MANASGSGLFHGWWIVGVSFFAQFLALGCSISVYGLFIPVLNQDFGASFMTANLGLSLLAVVMAGAGAVIGPILDRRSIRAIMIAGTLLSASCYALMSMATELWQLGVLFGGGVACGAAMFGPLAANTVVAKWFSRHRGKAVGIASMGAPTGGLLLSPLVGVLITDVGWREALLTMAGLHVLLIPLLWLTIRNRPEDMGLLADGGSASPVEAELSGRVWSAAEVLRSGNFWFLALAFGVAGVVAGSFNANVIPYSTDIGIPIDQAAFFISAIGGTAIVGTVLFGALADRMNIRALLWASFGLQAVTFVFLRSVTPDFGLLMVAVLVFGLAAGAMMPLMAAAVGRGFGPVSFGRVMGFIGPVTLPFGFLGPPVTGLIRETTGSYLLAFDVFVGVFVVGSVILLGVKLPKAGADLRERFAKQPGQPTLQE